MKRIRIWADTHSTGMFDDIGKFYDQSETTLSSKTWNELQNWVVDYDHIIPMDNFERERFKDEIRELDARGLHLMECIKSEWKHDLETKEELFFVYYSEGLLKEIQGLD